MIKAPSWVKDAHPTLVGWVSKRSGELLLCRKYTAEQIAEWENAQILVKPAPNLEIDINVGKVPKTEPKRPTLNPIGSYLRGLIGK